MDKIVDLAMRMRAKRESGSHPYVLVLGAGASVSSGTRLNRAVVERVVGTYDLKAFDEYLGRCSNDERFAILRALVEGTSPSEGYQCLAKLIQVGYFDVILSTNFDPLLEDAIAGLQMRRRDYIFLVHGVMDPDFIADHLDNPVPRVKIFKLHGDLFYYKFYYTGEEIQEFPQPIQRALEIYLNPRDILIVGHGMRDHDINRCLKARGGSIWYVGPTPPSGEIATFMQARKSEDNFISGDDGVFDHFFTRLRAELLGGTAEVSVDAISQAIFAVLRKDGMSSGSGFLLGDTRLVVTDSSILASLGQGMALGVTANVRPFAGGPQRRAELVVAPQTQLDYAVFRIPDIVEVSPLELADELPTVGEHVTACISVGQAQGFRDGTVTGVNCNVAIGMGGGRTATIPNLIKTDIRIAPGACGSPLVRKDGRVVGVLVAGNGGGCALTALRLREMLAQKGGF
jgi:Trypsin-like peptidase domain/SIR2-like domain